MIFDCSKTLPQQYFVASRIATDWLLDSISTKAIASIAGYTHTDKSPEQIAQYVSKMSHLHDSSMSPECELKLLSVPWYKKASYRNTIAVHSHGSISFNPKFLGRDISDIINTIVHEYMHYIGFSHKGNKPSDYNLKSVPYAVGALAESWHRSISV